MDDKDLYCVTCGESLLGQVDQCCPVRSFDYDPKTRHWHERTPMGGHYFVCPHCGSRLDEDVQEHLFEFIVPWDPPWQVERDG